jgi:hypothetical protein
MENVNSYKYEAVFMCKVRLRKKLRIQKYAKLMLSLDNC